MRNGNPTGTPLLRDQQRALHAYESVRSVPEDRFEKYEGAVQTFGHSLLTMGLCAALAAIQRLGDDGRLLLDHLASAGITGLAGSSANSIVRIVREDLSIDGYMIATREALLVVSWLKRAVQARSGEADDA